MLLSSNENSDMRKFWDVQPTPYGCVVDDSYSVATLTSQKWYGIEYWFSQSMFYFSTYRLTQVSHDYISA